MSVWWGEGDARLAIHCGRGDGSGTLQHVASQALVELKTRDNMIADLRRQLGEARVELADAAK